ncbi:MAG: beta-galactosidase [Planctomycetes bacterium]|nr:beta-galactosidase [Planctomycetota bacterium]
MHGQLTATFNCIGILALPIAWSTAPCAAQEHTQGPGHELSTRWSANVSPQMPWPEYPRPQLVRDEWTNLNGRWDYAVQQQDAPMPTEWQGEILVPFCIESALSGVGRSVGPDQRLWYHCRFDSATLVDGRRALLHFGAVDWECTIWLNGAKVGSHQGGYDAFTFDVTDHLRPGANELVVSVLDPTDAGFQPRGKQVRKPGGIWYTAVTGIWQTVWIEHVPASYVDALRMTTDPANGVARIEVVVMNGETGTTLSAQAHDGGRVVATATAKVGAALTLTVPDPRPWTPDDPHLYEIDISLHAGDGRAIDAVSSYFGLRSIAVAADEAGVQRLMLNGKPLFQYGLLDQGWWPDGLYTAPTDEALRYDIEVTKALGFNMARKHVKVEPQRWYTWCDRLGLLVWQDMPSGDAYISGQMPDITRTEESARSYTTELGAMIDGLRDHPSIVMWVPYNEGWGQWDTARICDLIHILDPTRPIDSASGWTDRGKGSVHDVHRYPGPGMPALEKDRAAVLGEFGGLGLPLQGHTWQDEANCGYRSFATAAELTAAYVDLVRRLEPLVWRGLAAAVYTQTTDVEIEVNGVMTYDRARIKIPVEAAAAAARRLYLPAPTLAVVLPTSEVNAATWRFTNEDPGPGWFEAGFAADAWHEGPGGFGEPSTPGAVVRTRWKSADIWLRREIDLGRWNGEVRLSIHHDEDASVYLNGILAARLHGYTTGYELVPIDGDALAGLHEGKNLIAIHCHQTGGGQYIDAGLITLVPKQQ